VRLVLVSVGRTKAGPECDLTERYLERATAAGRGLGLAFEHREIDQSRARRPQDRKLEEAKAIRPVLSDATRLIACDQGGRSLTSAEFAADLGKSRDQGVPMVSLVLGGQDGLDPDLRAEADLVLAFGAMTWPHQLARTMAAEQIYRAVMILSGHPYHRI
jgi:23S rRNA (pseudouridine1915-N3)-methyltransferase